MSGGAIVGLLVMLGAVVWCLASLVHMAVGPNRGAALKRSGMAVALFVVGGIIVGSFGARSTAPNPSTASNVTESEAGRPDAPVGQAAAGPLTEAVVSAATIAPLVAAQYQTSPTLISLVITGATPFSPEALRQLATTACAGASFCSVGFWTDDALAPRFLRMTPEQESGRLAQYVHSARTGLDALNWNCGVDQASSECR